jgi:uncharacterized RmlC-like cupin family protein
MTMTLEELYGVRYLKPRAQKKETSDPKDLYAWICYAGDTSVTVEQGDSAFWLSSDQSSANLTRGPAVIQSSHFATVIRGYSPENKTSTITNKTVLPYINGCSTKQIFPPDRPGDPTLQMLHIPPHAAEQAHHIHSTVRCVFVLSGKGKSIVGMEQNTVTTELVPGMICILERMCPHHFETSDSPLVVLPVHIWSTVPGIENNHPMFNGTFRL